MRTTVDIDDPILRALKKLQRTEGKSLGRLISDLLAQALAQRDTKRRPTKMPRWTSKEMNARLDLTDKEAVYAALDRGSSKSKGD